MRRWLEKTRLGVVTYNQNIGNIRNLYFFLLENVTEDLLICLFFCPCKLCGMCTLRHFFTTKPHIKTTTSQLATQRSAIIDNIAQGILGNGDKEGTNAVSIKAGHVYTFKRAYHTSFHLQQRGWRREISKRGELTSRAGRFHYLGSWKGCLTKKEGMTLIQLKPWVIHNPSLCMWEEFSFPWVGLTDWREEEAWWTLNSEGT